MVTTTKLTLSPEELLQVKDSAWILTKRNIIEKAVILMGELAGKMQAHIAGERPHLPVQVALSEPKISKGESYLQLPYVLLDYPRHFDKENVFAVRTMFWWGNFFSITLHLSGIYKNAYKDALILHVDKLQRDQYYLCIGEEQWAHHFEPQNYAAAASLPADRIKDLFHQHAFIKIARKFSLEEWDKIPELLEDAFLALIALISPSAYP